MTIIIFGAASAIAQATIRLWAKQGHDLYLVDRNEDSLKIVADDAIARGAHSAHTTVADLTHTDNHPALLNEAIETTGSIDIAFIAYGTLGDQKAGEERFAVAQQELLTNCVSVLSLLTELANYFEKKGSGTIAAISSVAGDRGRKSNYIYGTAKGALTIFLQGLRHRLAHTDVHVLTIKPGFVDTPMTKEFKKGLLWAKPDQIAQGIIRAIDKKKRTVYLPFFWKYIMCIIRAIPEPIFLKLPL